MRKLWNRFDAFLVTVLLAAALVGYVLYRPAATSEDRACVVTVDGKAVMTVSLDEDRVFSPPGHDDVEIEVSGGAVAFARSGCHDKTCVRSGYLREPGQMAACLPNRVAIRILSVSGGDGPDAVI